MVAGFVLLGTLLATGMVIQSREEGKRLESERLAENQKAEAQLRAAQEAAKAEEQARLTREAESARKAAEEKARMEELKKEVANDRATPQGSEARPIISASISSNRAAVGEKIQLNVTVRGVRGADVPQTLSVNGLHINLAGRSTQFEMRNFKMCSILTYTYIIEPQVEGDFIIPSFDVTIEGKNYRTQAIFLTVSGARTPPRGSPGTGPSTPASLHVTKEAPYENSLGMKFVPVPGTDVLFGVWDTRVKDFQAYAEASGYRQQGGIYAWDGTKWGLDENASWEKPGFAQTAFHPVVGVSWDEAKAFCQWLTARERGDGKIGKDQEYRLPTDAEWSVAVVGPLADLLLARADVIPDDREREDARLPTNIDRGFHPVVRR